MSTKIRVLRVNNFNRYSVMSSSRLHCLPISIPYVLLIAKFVNKFAFLLDSQTVLITSSVKLSAVPNSIELTLMQWLQWWYNIPYLLPLHNNVPIKIVFSLPWCCRGQCSSWLSTLWDSFVDPHMYSKYKIEYIRIEANGVRFK